MLDAKALRNLRRSSQECLHDLARELQRRIDAGELSADDAIAQSLEATNAHEKSIGAFVCHERSPRAQSAGPLRGIAVGIKDIMDTADFPTEMGSPIYRGYRSRGDAAVVMLLKQAGATIVGKTTTTAFASSDPTPTSIPQPWSHARRIVIGVGGGGGGRHDPARAGDADRRLGDPAGFVLRRGCDQAVIPLLPTVGVEMLFVDARYRRPVRSRRGRRGARAFRHDGPARPAAAAQLPTPRIGIVTQDFAGSAGSGSVEALRMATKAAERAGASGDVALPEIVAEAWRSHPVIQEFEAHQALAWEYRKNYDAMAPQLRGRLDESKGTTPAAYDEAMGIAGRARPALAKIFDDVDVC